MTRAGEHIGHGRTHHVYTGHTDFLIRIERHDNIIGVNIDQTPTVKSIIKDSWYV